MAEFYEDVYNKENKEWFLNTIDLSKYPFRWWERVFEKTYLFEKSKNKDLYNFTVPEILEFYKYLDVPTLTPLVVYNTNLVKYAQWALNENLVTDNQNHFDNIDNEILLTCVNILKVNQSIILYDDFMDIIHTKITNEQDKFIFMCMFEGIQGKDFEEILNLELSDINEKDNTVKLCTGREMCVSEEFPLIARAADAQTIYIGLTDKEWEIKLIPNSTIYKEKSNSRGKQLGRGIYRTVTRNINIVNGLNYMVNSKSIKISGMIYYLNRRADKLGISVEELLYSLENCQDILDKYQFNTIYRRRWLQTYKGYLH